MSRTPVREAALIVQAQGLVEVQPRKGVRIVAIDANEIDQIHDILTELECLSARCAAQLGYKREDLTAFWRHWMAWMLR